MHELDGRERRSAPTLLRARELALRALSLSFARHAALFRVFAYSVVVLAMFATYGVHSARGAVGERSLALGRELDGVRELLASTKTVELNGQRMMLSTAVVPLGFGAALDRFEELCRGRPHALAQSIELLPGATSAIADVPLARRLGILRKDGERDGIVACIVRRGEGVRDLAELVDGLARTLDVGLLGDFFYVYARDASVGDETRAHVITSWTHGSFRPKDMFPVTGDAPGSDSVLAARPGKSRRVLSGVAVGAPYAIRVYESQEAPVAALSGVEAGMAERGWTRMRDAGIPEHTRAFVHASGVTSLVTAAKSNGSESTVVSLVEMGAASAPWEPSAAGD